jgi:nitroreductase
MDIPFPKWSPAIKARISRRQFDKNRPIDSDKLAALETVCQQFKPFSSTRSCLVNNPGKDVFRGIIGSYGSVKNAPAFVAFIGNMDSPSVQEELGYTGEGVILEATALGLDTCWVAGFFSRKRVASLLKINSNERILAVSPVGYALNNESLEEKLMTGIGRNRKRLPLSKLVKRNNFADLPEWIKASIEAARLAPSAVNRQPWGFDIADGCVTVFLRTAGPEFTVSKRLDCGIAMLHFEVIALSFGIKGQWQFLKSPQVARFVPVR